VGSHIVRKISERVRILAHRVQTGSGAHPMGTGGSFPGGKAAEAWTWPFVSI